MSTSEGGGMFSFKTQKKQVGVHQLLRRAMNATSPNHPPTQGESRWEDRSNRTIPVLLAPYADGQPIGDEHTIALTKNLSSQGVALVLPQPFRAEQVLIGFWLDARPEFVLGHVRQNVPLGGGYWQLGVELTERTGPATCPAIESLVPLTARLRA
ncbi:MAG: hypothetical protein ABFD16_13625 [Thermoguttaceae bacterium]